MKHEEKYCAADVAHSSVIYYYVREGSQNSESSSLIFNPHWTTFIHTDVSIAFKTFYEKFCVGVNNEHIQNDFITYSFKYSKFNFKLRSLSGLTST